MNHSKQQRQISFRVSETEADIIKDAARASGQQQRDWLRLAVLSAVEAQIRGFRTLEEKVELQLLQTSFISEFFMQRAKGNMPDDPADYLTWCHQLYRKVEANLQGRHFLSQKGGAR